MVVVVVVVVVAAAAASEVFSVCWVEQLEDTLAEWVARSVVGVEAAAFENIDRQLHIDVDHKRRVEAGVVPAALVCRRDDHNDLVAVSMTRSPPTYGYNLEVSLRQWRQLQLQRR